MYPVNILVFNARYLCGELNPVEPRSASVIPITTCSNARARAPLWLNLKGLVRFTVQHTLISPRDRLKAPQSSALNTIPGTDPVFQH